MASKFRLLHAPGELYSSLRSPSDAEPIRFRRWKGLLAGYRQLIAASVLLTAFVLLINVIALAVASTRPLSGTGARILYYGDCRFVGRVSTALHFVINGLGTLLLAASNAAMQCLTAPTRRDIDVAHARGKWLHVGVGSVKNLPYIGLARQVTWLVLLLSSVPLHLVYNSVVSQSTEASSYYAVVATQDFLSTKIPNDFDNFYRPYYANRTQLESELHIISAEASTYTRLEMSDCTAAYTSMFVTSRTNLVIVTNATNQDAHNNGSALFVGLMDATQDFTPSSTDSTSPNNSAATSDIVDALLGTGVGSSVYEYYAATNSTSGIELVYAAPEYCLSKELPGHCSIQFQPWAMVVVIFANVFKITGFVFILLKLSHISPLVTMGDAIASFLSVPDPMTSKSEPLSQYSCEKFGEQAETYAPRVKRPFSKKRRRPWRDGIRRAGGSVSQFQRLITYSLSILWLVGGAVLVYCTVQGTSNVVYRPDLTTLYKNGFGNVDPADVFTSTISHNVGLGANTIAANALQLPLSLIYLTFNQFLSEMCGSAEIMRFVKTRKTLRVTEPRGRQRSTYWLSLPFRYVIPLLVAGAALHWAASATFFVFEVLFVPPSGDTSPLDGTDNDFLNGVAYSPLALLITYLIGMVMVIVIIVVSHLKLPRGMPVLGSCSKAISAACHHGGSEPGVAQEPLMYGVVEMTGERTGLVGFSSEPVEPLQDHLFYNGDPEVPLPAKPEPEKVRHPTTNNEDNEE